MESAIFGLVGVLLGIIINEIVRRRNRIESFATRVFDKRLEIYEELYRRIRIAKEVADDVIENSTYSKKQRHQLVSNAIHAIAGWCEDNDMYLSEELAVHCVPLLMGVEDIHDIKDEKAKQLEITRFRKNLRDAKKMIRKEAGIADIENLFSAITKPKHNSAIIEYYRKAKKEMGATGKWD